MPTTAALSDKVLSLPLQLLFLPLGVIITICHDLPSIYLFSLDLGPIRTLLLAGLLLPLLFRRSGSESAFMIGMHDVLTPIAFAYSLLAGQRSARSSSELLRRLHWLLRFDLLLCGLLPGRRRLGLSFPLGRLSSRRGLTLDHDLAQRSYLAVRRVERLVFRDTLA